MMKKHLPFFILIAALACAFAATKPPPVKMPKVEWDRTFLTPSRMTFDNDRELYLSWTYSPEAATSKLHISKRPVDESTDWVDVYIGNVGGFSESGSDVRMGEWFGVVTLDEKLYIWVEYLPPPIVHTNGVFHLSGVYHALDTTADKYVAPTIEVKRIDDDGEIVYGDVEGWKIVGESIDDETWNAFLETEKLKNETEKENSNE